MYNTVKCDLHIKADPDIEAAAKTEVRVMRIAEYINTVVAARRRPDNSPGAVVMKLDVEVGYNYSMGTKEYKEMLICPVCRVGRCG